MGGARELLQARELPGRVLRVSSLSRRCQCRAAGMSTVHQGRGVRRGAVRELHPMPAWLLQGGGEHRRVRALPGQHLCGDGGVHGPESLPELSGQVIDAGRDRPEQQASMCLRQGVLPHHQPGGYRRRGAFMPGLSQRSSMRRGRRVRPQKRRRQLQLHRRDQQHRGSMGARQRQWPVRAHVVPCRV